MSARAGHSNRHLRGTDAPLEPRGDVLPQQPVRIPSPVPVAAVPANAREPDFYLPPEFLREADQVPAVYSQEGLHIPDHLPRFSSGHKYCNRKQYVNTSDAEIFALCLSRNEEAIQEILY